MDSIFSNGLTTGDLHKTYTFLNKNFNTCHVIIDLYISIFHAEKNCSYKTFPIAIRPMQLLKCCKNKYSYDTTIYFYLIYLIIYI